LYDITVRALDIMNVNFSSLPGHAEAVISVSFSPDGRHLASGSGDTTVRFWDILTQTPVHTCHGKRKRGTGLLFNRPLCNTLK